MKWNARADEAERETVKLKRHGIHGNNISVKYFDGVVSGITKWGVYVELENTIEGLVHVANMTDDYYEYYEERHEMVGTHTGKTYKLGQTCENLCTGYRQILTRTIDFKFARRRGRNRMAKANGKMIANNKKAYHDYFIVENFEAGIALHGNRSKVPAYGKMQYQRIVYPYRKWRSVYLWHAHQSI